MSVTVTTQSLLADDITQTVVTAVTRDAATGNYVREFRFFGEPPTGSKSAPLILTVRAVSPDEDALRIETPAITI